jgi:rSAM/selenodomain-associated transferase 2
MVADAPAPLVTVIIPVLRDAVELSALLAVLPRDPAVEIVVVDGAPDPEPLMATLEQHQQHVVWVRSAAGRGLQMNRGAACARGEWLLFLHADTRLGEGWFSLLQGLADQSAVGGSFRFALDTKAWRARLIEWGVKWRVRLFDLPYGDQGLFARRAVFLKMGGYREWPLMEDVDFVRRLRKEGRLVHSGVPALTSARRYARDGWLTRVLGNWALVTLFLAGCPPECLASHYHRRTT